MFETKSVNIGGKIIKGEHNKGETTTKPYLLSILISGFIQLPYRSTS